MLPDRGAPQTSKLPGHAAPHASGPVVKRGLFAAIFLALVGTVCLGLLELGVRLFRPYEIPPYPERPHPGAPEFEASSFGYRLRLDSRFARPVSPKRPGVVPEPWVSNSDGFRATRELDEPDERTRVLVIGDSFVFGLGVDQADRFTDQLERLRPDLRVDNLGMNGFGTDLMLMAYEDVALDVPVDAVVLCYFVGGFSRVWPYFAGYGYALPRYVLEDGALKRIAYPRRTPLDALQVTWWVRQIHAERTQAERRMHEALLDRMRAHAQEREFELILAYLPGKWPEKPVDAANRAWVHEVAARHALRLVDLDDALRSPPTEAVYLPDDIHWNPAGHRIVAGALAALPFEGS